MFRVGSVLLAMVLAVIVNVLVFQIFGPTAAIIEAAPGGVLIGFLVAMLSLRKRPTELL